MKKHIVNGQELPVFDPAAHKKKKLEKDVEADIGKYAKSKGCLYEKFTSPSRRSVPDRMITTKRGIIGFLEVKRPGERPTVAQEEDLKERQSRGCNAEWCNSVEGGKMFIDKLIELDGTSFVDDLL